MKNELEQILDIANFLGLSHGSLLAEYGVAKSHREQLWKHQHEDVLDMTTEQKKICSVMAMGDVRDHYAHLILSYMHNDAHTEQYILKHRW